MNETPSCPSAPPIMITHFLSFSSLLNLAPSIPNINKSTLHNNLSLLSSSSSLPSLGETMRRRPHATFLFTLISILTFASFSLHLSRNVISIWRPYSDELTKLNISTINVTNHHLVLRTTTNNNNEFTRQTRRVSSIDDDSLSTVSLLIPDWEILVIVAPNMPLSSSDQHHCLFPHNATSPAKFHGVLPFTNRATFKCDLPESVRRRRIFSQPMLVSATSKSEFSSSALELLKWNFLVYESFSTENDVVVFAKGVNHRKGYDRSPKELRCVFDLGNGNRVRSAVTSSVQEVFRCPHPHPDPFNFETIGISLEIVEENLIVPSVAYYNRPNNLNAVARPKHFLCACTMVYNVAKFLREWIMYHAKVGVDNFILYDNGSDDDFYSVIEELRKEGYNISTLLWIWPKTQEAGFSHSIEYSRWKGLCSWIMYVDVDEFVYSPSWGNNNKSVGSLKWLLERETKESGRVGQVSMRCMEFGPSGNKRHPVEGVTQGYTCRRRGEQRHKSMVLVEAVEVSLRNVIHHFELNEKEGYKWKHVSVDKGIVNHYKYQAWDEFKTKFRRRVSAYVVDWKNQVNPNSKDRTPGLGFQPLQPKDWTHSFCQVRDNRLKSFTRSWFGSLTSNGFKMAWQTT